ncbi:hypothetical protein A2755_03955 [Candidatus Wolfebacteria bacterium RIFCSPHIGHO2_01_FULL_48_22]|uniref:Peptidase S24/S26A/S26B/S26C domain-containing protein n=2 Tax=Candidatus Wolfeibacteriota TaxID=1752735 RepID=A0A1F8DPI0_9BACT|nr:MAG: hypothetical protein A2755_03955 [Candidatus Wolfebacteria bacterium RIFCSPHIGHO2_01_FULL_48_22]OGM93492.1 MAG: hypothetical protein A2935_01305 [Candidatus Wolfebacteria bacterium RIFCSPLOWO2_01_FULL_47_17b]
MHKIQEQILHILSRKNLSGQTLREIGSLIGESSPQKVKHHLLQLTKKRFIRFDGKNRIIERALDMEKNREPLISLPVVGAANCGPATIFADTNIERYLKISRKLIPSGGRLFVLRAEGNSMNKARVKGKNIEDGDFVLIDANRKSPKDKDYIVSVIDGTANIKRFYMDKKNKRIILKSESTHDHLPIFIHPDDDYQISGTVVDIVKNPEK